ncbi:putative ATP-dependent RNA helicase SoYb [Drosophila busckii]|nr:putative ATP-dependent RNA helicase SoYb [Drosophila busckii]
MEPSIVTRMQQLNVGKKRAMCVQRYAWPHVAAGRALCVIGNELTGKTWCYLPAACQLVNKEVLRRMDNSSDYGPSCIILCANVGQGEHIADSCTALLDTAAVKVERLVKLFDRSIVQEVALRLRSACGILLTTVELLLQLCQLDTNKAPIFNPLAIRCVAIDNLDIMWRCDRLDVNKAVDWMLKLLRFEQQHTQLIIVGRLYVESLMKRLLPLLPDLLLLFEDELEASIYIGIKQELLITSEQQRDEQLLQLLLCKQQLEQQQPQRVVLTCQTIKNAEMLGQLLASRDIDSYNIMDCKNYEDIKLWSNSERKFVVLIVSDEAVPKLNDMPPIDCLIHYNYAVGWSRFKSRFRLYYGNFRLQRQSSAIIAVCVSDVDPIWYICDFMMKHDQLVPEPWLNLFTNQRTESEHAKPRIAKSLCRQLLAFGNCCRRSCLYRHILWDYETAAPANHPGQGDIRFYVLFCLSPARFAIRRVKYGVSSYFHNMPVTKLGEQIQLHYEQSENRVLLSNPQPGQLCIAKLNQQYQRVCITQEHSDDRVEIKQLDAGVDFLIVNSSDLMVCHDRFVEDEFEANDLRITGLTPLNMERIWPDDAKRLVRNKFFNRPTGKVFRVFTAKVDFCFHETIFVENVYDEAGNDLKSLVLNNLAAHMDESVRPRLLKTAAAAKPYEEAAEGFLEK